MSDKRSVSVRIRGQEFRIRTDESDESMQRIAGYLDETMRSVESRTGTVDSRDVAILTALNLAREVMQVREGRHPTLETGVENDRVQNLIELAESAEQREQPMKQREGSIEDGPSNDVEHRDGVARVILHRLCERRELGYLAADGPELASPLVEGDLRIPLALVRAGPAGKVVPEHARHNDERPHPRRCCAW